MKILVGYKRVVDCNVRIQVKPDGSGVVSRRQTVGQSVRRHRPRRSIASARRRVLQAKSSWPRRTGRRQAHLRNGLAMGANRAVHVVTSEGDPAADRGAGAAQAGREGTAADRAARQAGDRRRRADRADAGRAVEPAAGDIRIKVDVRQHREGQRAKKSTRGWRRSKSTCRP